MFTFLYTCTEVKDLSTSSFGLHKVHCSPHNAVTLIDLSAQLIIISVSRISLERRLDD